MQGDWAGYLLNRQWYRELKKSFYLGKPHFKCQQSQGQSSIRSKGHQQNHSQLSEPRIWRPLDKEPKVSRSLASTEGPWQCLIVIPLCICFLLLYIRLPSIRGLEQHKFIILQFCSLEVPHGSPRSTLKMSAELRSFPMALGGHLFPCLSAGFEMKSTFLCSWPLPLSSHLATLVQILLDSCSLSLSVTFKNPCNYIEHPHLQP